MNDLHLAYKLAKSPFSWDDRQTSKVAFDEEISGAIEMWKNPHTDMPEPCYVYDVDVTRDGDERTYSLNRVTDYTIEDGHGEKKKAQLILLQATTEPLLINGRSGGWVGPQWGKSGALVMIIPLMTLLAILSWAMLLLWIKVRYL